MKSLALPFWCVKLFFSFTGMQQPPDLIISCICLYNDILKNFYIATILM